MGTSIYTKLFLGMALTAVVGLGNALADTVAVPVTSDTWVKGFWNTSPIFVNDNYGCEPLFEVGNFRAPADSLVRFDLTDIDRPAPTLLNAKLEATFWQPTAPGNFDIGIHRITESWIEGRGQRGAPPTGSDCTGVDGGSNWPYSWNWAHWGNRPGVDPVPSDRVTLEGVKRGDRVSWDVTELVRTWLDNPATNHGLLLREESGVSRTVEFISHEIDVYSDFDGWDTIRLAGESPVLLLEFRPLLRCEGFDPPLDDPAQPVSTGKGNRALPIRARLYDAEGFATTDTDLNYAPVAQIIYSVGTGGVPPLDVSDLAESVGHGNDGNQFTYTLDGNWQLNLKLKMFKAPGTYMVTMIPGGGESAEYLIEPTCTFQFVID